MSVGGLVGWREMEGETYRFSMASVTASEVSVDIAIAWPIRRRQLLGGHPPRDTLTKKKKPTVQKSGSLTPLISVLLIENNTFECFTCVGVYVCQAF